MADDTQDIFGKIDAMLSRRSGFAARSTEVADEFPLLTEVVSEGTWTISVPPVDALSQPATVPPRVTETPQEETPSMRMSEADIDRLAAALEARMSELFIRQQLRIESLVRRVVREELGVDKDSEQ